MNARFRDRGGSKESVYKTEGSVATTGIICGPARLSKPSICWDRTGCVPVVLLYIIRRAFSFAAAYGAFLWIAADARHELGEQTRCARSCVPRRGDAIRDGLFSRLAVPDRLGTVAVQDTGPA